jgi:anti-sigma factor RsiW
MKPEEAAKLLDAYVDGELDAARCVEMEAALAASPALRAQYERLRGLGAAMRDSAQYFRAPAKLRSAAIMQAPAGEPPRPRRTLPAWMSAALAIVDPGRATAFLVGAALAATIVAVAPRLGDRGAGIGPEVVASHVRATLGERLIDVASSDQHTVKPWLSARLDFSPPVADYSAQGFVLVGGRVDYIGGKPVAVLVYQRRKHNIDVYVAPSDAGERGPVSSAERGFNIEHFARGGMAYWLVSDLNANELGDLAKLLGAGG